MTQEQHLRAMFDELHRQGFSNWDALELELVDAWNKTHGIEKVRIISAKELTSEEKKGFEAKLAKADITYAVDPSLMAGVKLEWQDRVLDVSVAGMIRDLKKSL